MLYCRPNLTVFLACGLSMLACVDEFDEQDLELEELVLEVDEIKVIDDDGKSYVIEATVPAGEDIAAPLSMGFDDTVQLGQYRKFEFTKLAGVTYKICITPYVGNPDLYGHYTGFPTTVTYQFRSIKLGTAVDCIQFTATQTGPYYLSVYGKTWSQYSIAFL